jgi:hypothetical protein
MDEIASSVERIRYRSVGKNVSVAMEREVGVN